MPTFNLPADPDREYAPYLEDRLPVPHETPDGEIVTTFRMRRMTAKERREFERSIPKGEAPEDALVAFARNAYPRVLVQFGHLEPPIPREALENMDVANEDFLVEAFIAVHMGFPNVKAYREYVREQTRKGEGF